jgi:hypothetical protein
MESRCLAGDAGRTGTTGGRPRGNVTDDHALREIHRKSRSSP